ncbi:MAG TPA: hypothetical protein VHC21_01445 [Candidatus Saccharimonadales bacterium]|nr:hypothetical protein [Candidatus Saccharimonadales bacterium]
MNSKRVFYGLAGLIILLAVGLLAGAYGVTKLMTSRATTLTSLKAKSQALNQEQSSFSVAQENVKKYAGLEQIAKSVVPQDKSQAQAVRQLVNIANANGVALGSITFPASSLGSGVTGSSTTATGSTTPSSAPASGGTSASASAGSSAKDALSQLTPVVGIPGVYQLTITVTGDSNQPVLYNQLINFLSGLEHDRRTAQVNAIVIQPSQKDPRYLGFTLTLNEYIKP